MHVDVVAMCRSWHLSSLPSCGQPFSDAIPIVFEETSYSVGEAAGGLEICAVAPASLDVAVAVTVQATAGGTAQGILYLSQQLIEHQTSLTI